MGIKILHLSDLHFGKSQLNIMELAYKILLPILKAHEKVNFIVFTGDIVNASEMGKPTFNKLQDDAVEFFNILSRKLKINKNNFIFVPGNHEINRNSCENDFSLYEDFLNKFYNEEGKPESYGLNNFYFNIFDDEKIIFAGFNSAKSKKPDVKKGRRKKAEEENVEKEKVIYGNISNEELSNFQIEMMKIENDYIRIACLHHHFYLKQERDKTDIDNSVINNSEEFLNALDETDFKIVLHGHKHENSIRRIIINSNFEVADKIATVIGCGSTDKDDTLINNFNIIEVFDKSNPLDLIIHEYTYSNSNFKPTKTFKFPIEQEKFAKKNLKDLLEYDTKLKESYKNLLFDIDLKTSGKDKLVEVINNSILTLDGICKNLKDYPNIIFYIISTIHFRINFYEGDYIDNTKNFFEQNINNDFTNLINKLLKLLECKNIYELKKATDELSAEELSYKERTYLTFINITFFITELYLSITERCEEFFNIKIKNKADFKFEQNEIKTKIVGAEISIKANDDKRALEIKVNCNTAKSHKVLTLIIKEFEIILTQFEKEFEKVGFKIYFIVPTVSKCISGGVIDVESYNFSAYIPKLIPLLAGENLYSQKEVFVRELIQNSIDAINVRVKKSKEVSIDPKIAIRIYKENGCNIFEISDNGMGMNKYLLERYLTTIGLSFYKSDDYNELEIEYSPISNFGIGFLSSFLVGDKIEVNTKHYEEDKHGYHLTIPNIDGCFFIEEISESNNIEIGTTIKILGKKINFTLIKL